MREILFRGKRTDGGEWVYGYPVGWQNEEGDISIVDSRFGACIDESGNLMMLEAPFVAKVDPATIGQYTGLCDKDGKKIFEGDIIECWDEHSGANWMAVVEFGNPNCTYSWGWQLRKIRGNAGNTDILLWVDMEETGAYIEVVGTIYDKEVQA